MGKTTARTTKVKKIKRQPAVTGKKKKMPEELKDTPQAQRFRDKRYGNIDMPCPACFQLMSWTGKRFKCKNPECGGAKAIENRQKGNKKHRKENKKPSDKDKNKVKRFIKKKRRRVKDK